MLNDSAVKECCAICTAYTGSPQGLGFLNNLNADKLWMTSFLHRMVLQGLNAPFLSG